MSVLRPQKKKPERSRRKFLAVAAVAGGSVALTACGNADDTPVPTGANMRPYGERAPQEKIRRTIRELTASPGTGSSRTPLQDLYGIITPSALHYERHHAGVPAIDPATHTLLIHGLVDKPLVFTLDDIRRFPATSRITFLECGGNSVGEQGGKFPETVQGSHGLLSGAQWTGRGKIRQVEVSVDNGKTWAEAELQEPVLPKALTAFRFPWRWNGEETVIQCRCTDETGYLQPTREELIAVRGLYSGYHYNGLRPWRIRATGEVQSA